MRRPWLFHGAAALALTAGCWASTCGADDGPKKSSWGAKLWPWSSAKKMPEGQKDATGQPADEAKASRDAARRLRAEMTWKRRAEVCQKLRQIAYETKDEELDRVVDRLDQRAWDAYVKQTSGEARAEPIERIGVDFGLLESGAAKKRED